MTSEDGTVPSRTQRRKALDGRLYAPVVALTAAEQAAAAADRDAEMRATWGLTPEALAEARRQDRELGERP
jgi:hypothetical protein